MNQSSSPQSFRSSTSTRYARDAILRHDAGSPNSLFAELSGLVTSVSAHGKIHFLDLADVSGTIQVVSESSKLDSTIWAFVRKVRKMNRVSVTGFVDKTQRGDISLFTTSMQMIPQAQIEWSKGLLPEQSGLTSQFFLARLRRRAVEFFQSKNFEEFEPEYLSPGKDTPGLQPLGVLFHGWGEPAHLHPSPMKQLVSSVLVAAVPQVFSVSRCFSPAVRDGYTSAESLIVGVAMMPATIESLTALATAAVQYIFSDITTLPNSPIDLSSWKTVSGNTKAIPLDTAQPCIEYLNDVDLSVSPRTGSVIKPFRLLLPPSLSVVEGHCETLREDITLGGFTIHLERMLKLIKQLATRRMHVQPEHF